MRLLLECLPGVRQEPLSAAQAAWVALSFFQALAQREASVSPTSEVILLTPHGPPREV
jgi:hypothetical protein